MEDLADPAAVRACLIEARLLIEDPMNHTQSGAYADDATGDAVDADDPRAVCWCAIGAVRAVAPDGITAYHAEELLIRASRFGPRPGLVLVTSDEYPHGVTMEMYGRAIRLADVRLADAELLAA